jgi:2-methylisocitrate lyase-like PEP mutase family enzyme
VQGTADLGALGFRLVIFPGGLARAVVAAMQAYFASLYANGTNAPFRERMLDFQGINGFVGTDEALAWARRFDARAVEDDEKERAGTAAGAGRR